MIIKLLGARQMQSALSRLIGTSDEIWIAVAWGYNGKLADLLMENSAKFQSITFGLNGFATSPDLVDRLIGVKNAFIAKAENGIFHPKLYLFRTGEVIDAIVGSANFTNGGLDRNHEACLHIRGSSGDAIFEQLGRELDEYRPVQQSVSEPIADSYRRQYDAARKRRGPVNPILPGEKNAAGLLSPLAMMTWDNFKSRAKLDPHHNFKRRIALLREIQRLFASVQTFSDLSQAEWKGVAGTLGGVEKVKEDLGHHDWGWFGSMGGNGDFAGLVRRRDPELAKAVDCIPRKDPVSVEHFNEFRQRFHSAFVKAKAEHVGGYPTATRLLAMKRPDTFVCANGKNRAGLAKALNFSPTTLSMENYWDRIIIPIQSAPWYNATRPDGPDSELWDYRVAMLDTIYYHQND